MKKVKFLVPFYTADFWKWIGLVCARTEDGGFILRRPVYAVSFKYLVSRLSKFIACISAVVYASDSGPYRRIAIIV